MNDPWQCVTLIKKESFDVGQGWRILSAADNCSKGGLYPDYYNVSSHFRKGNCKRSAVQLDMCHKKNTYMNLNREIHRTSLKLLT